MLEEVVDALLLEDPTDEIQIGLAVLDEVLTGRCLANTHSSKSLKPLSRKRSVFTISGTVCSWEDAAVAPLARGTRAAGTSPRATRAKLPCCPTSAPPPVESSATQELDFVGEGAPERLRPGERIEHQTFAQRAANAADLVRNIGALPAAPGEANGPFSWDALGEPPQPSVKVSSSPAQQQAQSSRYPPGTSRRDLGPPS